MMKVSLFIKNDEGEFVEIRSETLESSKAQTKATEMQRDFWSKGIKWERWIKTIKGRYCYLYANNKQCGEIRLEKIDAGTSS